jgi:hypothetical protein
VSTATLSPAAERLLASLDAEQAAAARSPERHLVVHAGPGSGKTRVLVSRIVHLLEERGLPSHSVLALCFTRAAAAEVKRRVVDVVGKDLGALLTACTIHSFALRVLRQDPAAAGFPEGFLVASEDEEAEILHGLFDGPERRPEASRVKVGAFRDALARMYATGDQSHVAEASMSLWVAFQNRLHARRLVTHGDLLIALRRLLTAAEGSPSHVAEARERIAHVLVDERQDVSAVEVEIVRALGAEETWVGDERQAIFGWRHAHGFRPEEVATVPATEMPDEPPDVQPAIPETIPTKYSRLALRRTYRFGPEIARYADHLYPAPDHAMLVAAEDVPSRVLEGDRLAIREMVNALAARHQPYNVAVLCRTRYDCERAAGEIGLDVAQVCTRTEPETLKAAVALARLILDPNDNAAFRTLWRIEGGGVVDLHVLAKGAGAARGLLEEWRRSPGKGGLTHATLIHEASVGASYWPMKLVLDKVAGRFGTGPDFLRTLKIVEGAEAVDLPIQDALDALSDRADDDVFEDARKAGKVAVATVHAFKGREAMAVVVCTNRSWPPASPKDEREREERRVAFVAVTRAKKELVVLREEDFGRRQGPR